MTTKTDELILARALLKNIFPRHVLEIQRNRKFAILRKWIRKGFYEYGVSQDLGWLTPKGKKSLGDPSLLLQRNIETPGPDHTEPPGIEREQ